MNRTIRGLLLTGALMGGGLFAAGAQAQEAQGWHGSITPYAWLAGVKGDVGAVVDSPPTAVDADFPDIFDALSGAFMGKAELGYGPFGVIGDISYVKVSGDHSHVGPVLSISGEIESATTQATLAGYWRIHQDPAWDFDILAGARYTKSELEIDLATASRQVSGRRDLDWWDPVIGARTTVRLNERWSLSGYADYGGFGVSSDMVAQLYGGVGWRFADSWTASLGYRYYKTEFSKGDFNYDLAIGGPILGVTYSF